MDGTATDSQGIFADEKDLLSRKSQGHPPEVGDGFPGQLRFLYRIQKQIRQNEKADNAGSYDGSGGVNRIENGPGDFRKLSGTVQVGSNRPHAEGDSKTEKTYRKILSLIKRSNLTPCSDLYSISLINLYDDSKNHTYFKYLFICAE